MAFAARPGGPVLDGVLVPGELAAARPDGARDALLAAGLADSRAAVVVIGPDTALTMAALRVLGEAGSGVTAVAAVRRGEAPEATLLDVAGALHVTGFDAAVPGIAGVRAQLPGRQWQRARHWLPQAAGAKPGMAARGGQTAAGLDRYCYEIDWREAAPPAAAAGPAAGRWLLLRDGAGIAEALAARLVAAGAQCLVTEPEAELGDLAQYRGVVHLGTLDGGPLRGQADAPDSVLDGGGGGMPGTAGGAPDGVPVSTSRVGLDAALARSCGPLPALAAGLAAGSALWIVTRGAVPAGDGTPVAPAQAPAWGMGRTIALEQPEIWGGMVDLDPQVPDPGEHAAVLAGELLGGDGEDQVAWRAGRRLAARLQPAPLPSAAPRQLDPAGAYLVTGGRGTLGLRIAGWLASRGARHLVLLGRTPLSSPGPGSTVPGSTVPGSPVPGPAVAGSAVSERDQQVQEELGRLRAAGVTVYTPSADVADLTAMTGLLNDAPWPRLRGVVHAAGVSEPSAVAGLDWGSFRRVLRAKAEGSLVLDAVTAGSSLDFFVMFSSASSVWGSALAGAYTAANYFEDVLAHDRARRGLPALAVNWGWWAGSGMAAHHEAYFESMGLAALPDADGFAILDRLLGSAVTQLTVAPVDWARFRPVMEAKRRRPLLELLGARGQEHRGQEHRGQEHRGQEHRGQEHSVPEAALAGRQGALLSRLRDAGTAAARLRLAEELVQAEVAAALGRDGADGIDRDLGFFEAGMDSITSVELKGRLEALLGVALPATAAFEHPTVAALAGYLVTEILDLAGDDAGGAAGAAAPPPEADDSALSAELDQLNEDELLRLLGDQLEEDRDARR